MKSKELEEKRIEAEGLEELIILAEKAEDAVNYLLEEIREFDFQEPHGWLSEIVFNLRKEIESKLERI